MPNIATMRESNFLKRQDVGKGALVTITNCAQFNVAKSGAPEELKWCLEFKEFDKPMVLNSTNAQLCAAILGSDETENWTGKQIVLYDDPNVSFSGKLVGGIRVRAVRRPKTAPQTAAAPKPAPAAMAAPPPTQVEPEPENPAEDPNEEDVPF